MNPHHAQNRVVHLLDHWRCHRFHGAIAPKAKLEAAIAIEELGYIPHGIKKLFI